jgi:hypothetical protein
METIKQYITYVYKPIGSDQPYSYKVEAINARTAAHIDEWIFKTEREARSKLAELGCRPMEIDQLIKEALKLRLTAAQL